MVRRRRLINTYSKSIILSYVDEHMSGLVCIFGRVVHLLTLGWDPANLEVCLRLKKVGKQWTLQVSKRLSEKSKNSVSQIGFVYMLTNN